MNRSSLGFPQSHSLLLDQSPDPAWGPPRAAEEVLHHGSLRAVRAQPPMLPWAKGELPLWCVSPPPSLLTWVFTWLCLSCPTPFQKNSQNIGTHNSFLLLNMLPQRHCLAWPRLEVGPTWSLESFSKLLRGVKVSSCLPHYRSPTRHETNNTVIASSR